MAQGEALKSPSILHPREDLRPPVRIFHHVYRPQHKVTNTDLVARGVTVGEGPSEKPLTEEMMSKNLGVEHRYWAAPGETVHDMAYKAAAPIIDQIPDDIKVVFGSTSFSDGKNLADELVNGLGVPVPNDPFHRDVVHGYCSGGVMLFGRLMNAHIGKRVLLVSSEKYSDKVRDPTKGEKDPWASIAIFSDGAVATSFVNGHDIMVKNFKFSTDFSADENAAILLPFDEKLVCGFARFVNAPKPTEYPDKLLMVGNKVLKVVASKAPNFIDNLLQDSNLRPEDVNHFILHQASRRVLEVTRERLVKMFGPQMEDKVYINPYEGNWSSGSNMKVTGELIDKGVIRQGDRVMQVAFGGGMAIAGTVLEFPLAA